MSKTEKRFEIVHQENSVPSTSAFILLDNITGVEYLFVHDGHAGGLTPLLGADGLPLIRTVLDDE